MTNVQFFYVESVIRYLLIKVILLFRFFFSACCAKDLWTFFGFVICFVLSSKGRFG